MLTCYHEVEGCLFPAYGIADVAGVGATVRLVSLPYPQLSGVLSELIIILWGKGMSILLPRDSSRGSIGQQADQLDERPVQV